MRLGVFGGTFDPVHLAHLILAETAREACALDEVWFIPAFASPFKQEIRSAPPAARLDMVRFAIAGHPQFRVSNMEIKREGVSYTVDTLQDIHDRHPQAELFLLMGADSLGDFLNWKDPPRILELATIVAVNRGRGEPDLDLVLEQLGHHLAERFRLISMPPVGISATDLRAACAAGRSIRYQTPRSVELYIQQHLLYQPQR